MLVATLGWGQSGSPAVRPLAWQFLGSRTVELELAGPAGGPVSDVFFSADGVRLFAVTTRGLVWTSSDLGETWTLADVSPETARGSALPARPAEPLGLPAGESSAAVYLSQDARFEFALGANLYRSTDRGRTWVNVTGDAAGSLIGLRQYAIAFSPLNPDFVIVANSRGLWRSADGGLSWSDLNANLPNLPSARITQAGEGSIPRLFLREIGPVQWPSSGSWQPASDSRTVEWLQAIVALPPEDQARLSSWPAGAPTGWAVSYRVWRSGTPISPDLTACASSCEDPANHFISAFAAAPDLAQLYAGTSDGRLWISADSGQNWRLAVDGWPAIPGPVTALFVDPREPRSAIAVLGGKGSGHVFRTTNGGLFWDDISTGLPDVAVSAVAANGETGSIYIASDAGVFHTRSDLRNPAPPAPWTRLAGSLPAGPVEDLRLDRVSGVLYALVAGHGLYRAAVPDVADALRLLNSADLSARAAAPGGLLTVMGAQVRAARVGDVNAPVLAAGQNESQIQVPFEVTGSTLSLALETQRGPARLGTRLEPVSPAIFVDSEGAPLVLEAASGAMIDALHPARAGSQILILSTGLGRVRPEWPTGLPAPLENPPVAVAAVTAQLNGAPVPVVSATLAGGYIGVYMVRVEIPAIVNAGTTELVISAGGKVSNRVTLSLEP